MGGAGTERTVEVVRGPENLAGDHAAVFEGAKDEALVIENVGALVAALAADAVKLAGGDSGHGAAVDFLPGLFDVIEGFKIRMRELGLRKLRVITRASRENPGIGGDAAGVVRFQFAGPVFEDFIFGAEEDAFGDVFGGDQLAVGEGAPLVVIDVKIKREGDLAEIGSGERLAALALSVGERGAGESGEHGDNGDDREEFNQCEPPRSRRVFR